MTNWEDQAPRLQAEAVGVGGEQNLKVGPKSGVIWEAGPGKEPLYTAPSFTEPCA